MSLQEKADQAAYTAYAWALQAYPGVDLPYVNLYPNARLKRAIARIFVAPKNRRIEYNTTAFDAVDMDYCVRVLKHEYLHLVFFLKDPRHYQDGDRIFEDALALHGLENNYNSNNRDAKAQRQMMMAQRQHENAVANKKQQAANAQRTKALNLINNGQGYIFFCVYHEQAYGGYKTASKATLTRSLWSRRCPRCGNLMRCFKLSHPVDESHLAHLAAIHPESRYLEA